MAHKTKFQNVLWKARDLLGLHQNMAEGRILH